MREQLEGLLRLTRRLDQEAEARHRALRAERERVRRRRLGLVERARRDAWRWNRAPAGAAGCAGRTSGGTPAPAAGTLHLAASPRSGVPRWP